jgi:transposase
MQEPLAVGIDISKDKFDLFTVFEGKSYSKVFANSVDGFQKMTLWLKDLGPDSIHCCMESTGGYQRQLALLLVAQNHLVSILNTLPIMGYALSKLSRTKTDPTDAALLYDYCLMHKPPLWTPPTQERDLLAALLSRCDDLAHMHRQEANRLEFAHLDQQRSSFQLCMDFLLSQIQMIQKQIREIINNSDNLLTDYDLLLTIPGIGPKTALLLVSIDLSRFDSARQLAAFFGLCPSKKESGKCIPKRARLSNLGPSQKRSALFFPAMVCGRVDQSFGEFRSRLLNKGKPKKVVLAALRHKLIGTVFGVIHSRLPYDPPKAASH